MALEGWKVAKAAGAPSDGTGNQKLHADVARSAFGSEHFESTAGSDHFWKLRCQSNARRCGAKHMSMSKRTEHTILGALLEVEMFKKRARCCGAKHILKSKWPKHSILGALLEVEMLKKCMPLWPEACFEVKIPKNTTRSDHFWGLRCRKSACDCGEKHVLKSKYQKTPHLRRRLRCRKSAGRCGVKSKVKSAKNWPSRTTFWT